MSVVSFVVLAVLAGVSMIFGEPAALAIGILGGFLLVAGFGGAFLNGLMLDGSGVVMAGSVGFAGVSLLTSSHMGISGDYSIMGVLMVVVSTILCPILGVLSNEMLIKWARAC